MSKYDDALANLVENNRDTLISLGWTPPGEKQTAQAEPVAYRVTVDFMGKTREFFTDLCSVAETLGTYRDGFIQPLYIAPPAVAVNEQMLELLKWIEKYVHCAVGESIKAAIAAAEAQIKGQPK